MSTGEKPLKEDEKILLEEYKLFVEMTDRSSARRQQANQFYIGLLSGILAILAFTLEKDVLKADRGFVFLLVAILGLLLCYIWNVNIRSYRQLSTGKFQVIHELEQRLPYPLYKREWEFLGEGKDRKKYFQLSRVEKLVPLVLSLPYLMLLAYACYLLI